MILLLLFSKITRCPRPPSRQWLRSSRVWNQLLFVARSECRTATSGKSVVEFRSYPDVVDHLDFWELWPHGRGCTPWDVGSNDWLIMINDKAITDNRVAFAKKSKSPYTAPTSRGSTAFTRQCCHVAFRTIRDAFARYYTRTTKYIITYLTAEQIVHIRYFTCEFGVIDNTHDY